MASRVTSSLRRVSPGVYRNKQGKLVDSKGRSLKVGSGTSRTIPNKPPGTKGERGRSKTKPEVRSREVTISGSDEDRQVIYGRFRVGGVWTYGQAGSQAFHVISTIAGHKIGSTGYADANVYIDGLKLWFDPTKTPDPRWCSGRYDKKGVLEMKWGGKVFFALMNGDDNQPVQPDLKTQSDLFFPDNNKWTAEDRQRGCAYAYLLLKFDNDLYPDGFPDVEFEINGKVCCDFRAPGAIPGDESTYAWTDNPALCIADYLTNTRFGRKVPWTDIDLDNFVEAANVCDELVAKAAGGVEKRYTLNGSFDFSAEWTDILEEMAATMGGDVVYQSGKWRIYPAKWRPISIGFDENDFLEPIRAQTKISKQHNFNTIKGKFISPQADYEAAEFPPVTNLMYKTEDGEELVKDIQLNFVTSSSLAQRLARIELERIRQCISLEIVVGLKGFCVQVCDTIELSFAKYGWNKKHFEVREVTLAFDANRGLLVTLALQETGEGVFVWDPAVETRIDVSPNTDLPSPFDVKNPTDLQLSSGTSELYIRADGTIFSRLKLSWTLPLDDFLLSGGYIEVQYKPTSEASWREHPRVTGNTSFTHILDVQDGRLYDVRIRSVNALAIANAEWVTRTAHYVVGKLAPPSDVTAFQAAISPYGIGLRWQPIPDLDLDHYEIRLGEGSWDEASFVAEVRGTSYDLRTRKAGNYRYMIKAVDTSRNYSVNEADLDFAVLAPEQVVATFSIQSTDVILTWTPPVSFFALDVYEISYGDDYLTSQLIQETRGTLFQMRIDWIGNRRFWIAARDVEGNLGAPGSVLVQVLRPNQVTDLAAAVQDNNVFLRWTAAAPTTLPIAKYRVFRGSTFLGATYIGDVGGTFSHILETISGSFSYWVQAVDSAGNVSAERVVTALVSEPPDFVLKLDRVLLPQDADVLSNIYIQDYGFIGVSAPTAGAGSPIGLLLTITQ